MICIRQRIPRGARGARVWTLAQIAFATAAAGLAAGASPAQASQPTIIDGTNKKASSASFDRLVAKAGTLQGGRVGVIVGLRARFDPAEATNAAGTAKLSLRMNPARAEILKALKGHDHRVVRSHDYLPFVSLELSADALAALRASGAAASVSEDLVAKPVLEQTTNIIESAPQVAFRGWDGAGQVVAILDSGVTSAHPFLANSIAEEACFSTENTCPNGSTSQVGPGAAEQIQPANDHGTKVAGVAAGRRAAGGTFDGVAPGAKIMPVNVFSRDGGAFTTNTEMIDGLQHVLNRANAGVKVASVNISIGSGLYASHCDDSPLKAPIDALRAKGIATIIASGNDHSSTSVTHPSCISTAVTVGAVDKNDAVILNASPQVELLAHGRGVTTSYADQGELGLLPTGGTSIAAPHVAGASAIYAQRFPGTSVSDALAAFQRGGKTLTDTRSGAPVPLKRLNVAGAFARWGYVVATLPGAAAYTPAATFRGNSTGGVNTVERTATGTYIVSFPGLGNARFGNAQATAYLGAGKRCQVRSFMPTGTTVRLGISCTSATGAPADAQFITSFQTNETRRVNKAGYLSSLTLTTHTPIPNSQANSSGGVNTVQRLSAGRYAADFPGFPSGTSGVPHVTAIGSNGNMCQITTWYDATVGVLCHNAAGVPTDTPFSLTIDHLSVLTGQAGGYIYANDMDASTAYSPLPDLRWNSTGAVNTSTRTGLGAYTVTVPGVEMANSIPMVTAVGATGARNCRPAFWSTGSVDVRCEDAAGAPVDSRFTLSYVRGL